MCWSWKSWQNSGNYWRYNYQLFLFARLILPQDYLTVLRSSQLIQHLTASYLVSDPPNSLDSSKPMTGTVAVTPKSMPEVSSVPETNVPPAFPQIQPVKAAKYFSEPAEGFGPWRLLLSSRAIQHLKGYHRDQKVWHIVKKKMQ
jgi:hypothetical protein